jgi:hypothetical protein
MDLRASRRGRVGRRQACEKQRFIHDQFNQTRWPEMVGGFCVFGGARNFKLPPGKKNISMVKKT